LYVTLGTLSSVFCNPWADIVSSRCGEADCNIGKWKTPAGKDATVINGLVDKESKTENRIGDGRKRDLVYGYEACRKNNFYRKGHNNEVADCQSLLALALSLQFPDKYPHFTWATGIVNLDANGGWPKYSPWHKDQGEYKAASSGRPARRALSSLRSMTEKANMFKRRVATCPEGTDYGYKAFVA
jgi:hypothetical protein